MERDDDLHGGIDPGLGGERGVRRGGGSRSALGRMGLTSPEVMVHPSFRDPPSFTYRPNDASFLVYAHASGYKPAVMRHRTLAGAISTFIEHGLPVVPNAHILVIDGEGVVVLGYNARVSPETEGEWIGVKQAFDMLGRAINPIDLAIWETLARENVGG